MSTSSQKVFAITGAGGRLGNVLVRTLNRQFPDAEIRSLLLPNESVDALTDTRTKIVRADVTKFDTLDAAFAGVDCVFHLAGFISLMHDEAHILDAVNVKGTANVVKACIKNNVQRLVHTASAHALEEPDQVSLMTEQLPLCPQKAMGLYGKSKAAGAQVVLEAVQSGQLDAVIVCPTGIIGPYDFGPSSQGKFVTDAIKTPFPVYCDGAYDFVDVRDVADGLVAAYQRGTSGEHYILSGERIKLIDIIRLSANFAGRKFLFPIKIPHFVALWAGKVAQRLYRLTGGKPVFTEESIKIVFANSYVSNEKARTQLGYSPRPAYKAIESTVQWFQNKAA